MKRILMIACCAVIAGCIPGEATIKISAENMRRVLRGEIVEIPVRAKVETNEPIIKWIEEWKEEGRCPGCRGKEISSTNAVNVANAIVRAATDALTIMLADGSRVTGGAKTVGTNIVYWTNVDTKFLFGTTAALIAASNKVENCNGCIVLDDKGEITFASREFGLPESRKLKHISKIFDALGAGCELCKDIYEVIPMVLVVSVYDSLSLEFEGDGKGGFRIETTKDRMNSENIGKEYKCVLAEKADRADGIGRAVKPVRVIPVER